DRLAGTLLVVHHQDAGLGDRHGRGAHHSLARGSVSTKRISPSGPLTLKVPPWASAIFWLTDGPTSSSRSEAMASGLKSRSRSPGGRVGGLPRIGGRRKRGLSGSGSTWIARRPSGSTRAIRKRIR